jgi:hypothetical protein
MLSGAHEFQNNFVITWHETVKYGYIARAHFLYVYTELLKVIIEQIGNTETVQYKWKKNNHLQQGTRFDYQRVKKSRSGQIFFFEPQVV